MIIPLGAAHLLFSAGSHNIPPSDTRLSFRRPIFCRGKTGQLPTKGMINNEKHFNAGVPERHQSALFVISLMAIISTGQSNGVHFSWGDSKACWSRFIPFM